MKRKYITPTIDVVVTAVNNFMETISIPTTGHVDNPSVGQSKKMVIENGRFVNQDNLWDD